MLERLIANIDNWKRLGEKVSENGSRVIGHIPRDYPEAYLHAFFSPLSENEWNEYGLSLPDQLQSLYKECNGLSFFAGNLDIYGIRSNYFRESSSARFQPFDLKDHNAEYRDVFCKLKKGMKDDRLFFGGYYWDGSGVYISTDSKKVFRCLRGKSKPVNEWDDLQTFLFSEYDRIEKLFDSNGYLIDEDFPTTPI